MLEIILFAALGVMVGLWLPTSLHKHNWILDSTEKRKSFYLDDRENVYNIWKCKDCCEVKIDVFSEKIKDV